MCMSRRSSSRLAGKRPVLYRESFSSSSESNTDIDEPHHHESNMDIDESHHESTNHGEAASTDRVVNSISMSRSSSSRLAGRSQNQYKESSSSSSDSNMDIDEPHHHESNMDIDEPHHDSNSDGEVASTDRVVDSISIPRRSSARLAGRSQKQYKESSSSSSDSNTDIDELHPEFNMDIDEDADDESEDKKHRKYHHAAKLDNHLPWNFGSDTTDLAFNYFLGLYTADGHNAKDTYLLGTGFKADQCLYLYQLLKAFNVKEPKLRFKPRDLVETYKAALAGSVIWETKNNTIVTRLSKLRFPSSKLKKGHLPSIERYFADDEDGLQFACFIVGFYAGDGSPETHNKMLPGRKRVGTHFDGVTFSARDRAIIIFIREYFEGLGCNIRQYFINQSDQGLNTICISREAALEDIFQSGIRALEALGVPLHDKVRLLKEFLKTDDAIPFGFLEPRSQSFVPYLGEYLNDNIHRVIGQDFYDNNLYQINDFYDALGLTRLESSDDFTLKELVDAFLDLDQRPTEALTMEQRLLKSYYQTCKKRVANGQPEDKSYVTRVIQQCPQCDHDPFPTPTKLEEHIKLEHEKSLFKCTHSKCGKEFMKPSQRKYHNKQVHVDKRKLFECHHCFIEIDSSRLMAIHYDHYHSEDNAFPCTVEGCSYVCKTQDHLNKHTKKCEALMRFVARNVEIRDTRRLKMFKYIVSEVSN